MILYAMRMISRSCCLVRLEDAFRLATSEVVQGELRADEGVSSMDGAWPGVEQAKQLMVLMDLGRVVVRLEDIRERQRPQNGPCLETQ